ncbi:MAG: DUF4416 family protein [Lentisphaerae bacterium]|jgi:hypothetical protein|nr:DUF4416 family protein [Lentisphaerota bacterium]MBT4822052.1 DUF4416 family protein [Lentisphaerota bacterium]MBT5609150.1 DUF4416 family protein [Lentisphaerota bacterium]MBT7054170.1 DUF4416 family protein [Lentisphaerota bacterium]MBT7841066.1 DUF4416 family protein [Lentisphaerota bacterium]
MLDLQEALPVKVVAAVLFQEQEGRWATACEAMADVWGPIDMTGPPTPFTFTDYYTPEMGSALVRQFVGFERLVEPEALAALKHDANAIEERSLIGDKRAVNIDVGYLDYHKLVLASTKEGPQKVYVGSGIWADITLLYRKGAFQALPWTFLDFTTGAYTPFLLEAREHYRLQIRQNRKTRG